MAKRTALTEAINYSFDGEEVNEDRATVFDGFLRDKQQADANRARKNLEAEELRFWSEELALDRKIGQGARKGTKKSLVKRLVAWVRPQAA